MRPRTGVENSEGLRVEFAQSWSAAAQSRLSMSLLLAMLLLPRYVCLVLIGSVPATSGHCFMEPETSEEGSGLGPVLLQLA
jgi:hypothetical protein